eukprot:Skav213870  [mRNA]  locus=scaffold2374:52607:53919:+ [translate_table: standard]
MSTLARAEAVSAENEDSFSLWQCTLQMQQACFDPVLIANASPVASGSPSSPPDAKAEPFDASTRTSTVRPDIINDNGTSKIKFFKENRGELSACLA